MINISGTVILLLLIFKNLGPISGLTAGCTACSMNGA